MRPNSIILAIIILVLGCAHTPDSLQIQEKATEYDEVDTFVTWLEDQPNIRDVNVNKKLFLTSHPPKVIVTFFHNDIKQELLLAVEPGHKLRIVKPQ